MRKTYIDNIRSLTVVLVVIYHVIYIFNGVTIFGIIGPFSQRQPQDVFMYIVYPWFMLLLFVISGIVARYDLEKKTAKEFIKNRTRKYLVPSTIGLFVWGWIMGYYNMLIGGAFESMTNIPKPIMFLIMTVSGTGPLWYIQMLWFFSIALVLIKKLDNDRFYNICGHANILILLILTLAIYGSAQILNTPIIVVYRFGIYGLGFLIGYFVLSHETVMDEVGKNWILLSGLAIIFGIIFTIVNWGKSYPDHEVIDTLLCNIFAWTGTLGVLSFMKRWGNFENQFTRWLNRKSWGIYIFHYLPLTVSGWYLRKCFPGLNPAAVYILVAISAFAGSVILYEIISRIPVIRWCVLGIKQNKRRV